MSGRNTCLVIHPKGTHGPIPVFPGSNLEDRVTPRTLRVPGLLHIGFEPIVPYPPVCLSPYSLFKSFWTDSPFLLLSERDASHAMLLCVVGLFLLCIYSALFALIYFTIVFLLSAALGLVVLVARGCHHSQPPHQGQRPRRRIRRLRNRKVRLS